MGTIAALIASLGAGTIAKLLSLLGPGFVDSMLKYYQSKDAQETERQRIWVPAMTTALNTEVQLRDNASKERIALWGDAWFKALVIFIVGGPALYLNAVIFVSIFHTFGWTVEAAPSRFEDVAFKIVLSFIGAGGFTGAIVGAAKALKK